MPLKYGKRLEDNGRNEPFAELEWNYLGDSYMVCCTALYPYKDYARGSDELLVHIDYMNVTQGTSGRFENVLLPGREQGDVVDGKPLRRFACFRKLEQLLSQRTPAKTSPVYP